MQMSARRPLVEQIDARVHLARLAGQTVTGVFDGEAYRVLGVTREHVYVSTIDAPLGKEVPVADVQAAFDRLASGEEVRLSDGSLGKEAAFIGAAMMSLPGATLLHGPARVRLGGAIA